MGSLYGQKEAGECSAQPHLRAPPLREAGHHVRRMVSLRLRATSSDDGQQAIHPKDMLSSRRGQ